MYETLLIVDDLDIEREMLTDLLENEYTILEARDGKECLEVVESCKGHIDAILLDLMMPEIDGYGVLKKRQEVDYFAAIPVLVLTASGNVEDQVKAFELGANDFISKPFIIDIVKSRINNVMASQKRMESLIKNTEEYRIKAELDQMTGIYNKATIEKLAGEVLENNEAGKVAFMIIDIDNFKSVNDIEGHQAGDHCLKIVADLISSQFRKSDLVGRLGGDEFFVCMSDLPSETIARKKAKDLVRLMKYKPNISIPSNVSLSIGLAFSDENTKDYTSLFTRADEALYESKKNGKARYTEYGHSEKIIENDDRGEIILFSRNRNVCSLVESIFDVSVKFVNVMNTEQFFNEIEKEGVILVYLDTSEDDCNEVWEVLENVEKMQDIPVLALCKEGEITQLRQALMHDYVKDVITTPIEIEQLKRRSVCFLPGRKS